MALAATHDHAGRSPAVALLLRLAQQPATWVAAATLLLVTGYAAANGPPLGQWLGDTDDAVRLVAVRDLIAGAAWFDTTLPRIGAPDPLVSHWSRLIDAPLAALMLALRPVLGLQGAELAVRAVWPLLSFVALAFLLARAAQRQAGAWAAAMAMLLVGTSAMGLAQFRPGRVDHHNIQILAAVGGILLLVQAVRRPRAGWAAGALIGLGLAVGFEAIGLMIPVLGMAAVLALRHPSEGRGIVNAAVAAAGTLALALIATTAPARLHVIHCDALSLNLVVLAAAGAAALWAAFAVRMGLAARLIIVVLGSGAGAMLYAALEPACLAGPFGQVNSALRPIWLDHVQETQSIFTLMARAPGMAVAQALFVLAGVAAALALWRRQRQGDTLLMAFAVTASALLGYWQVKLMPYATWLAVLPMAVLAARLPGIDGLSAPVVRIAALVLFSQTTLATLVEAAIAPFAPAAHADAAGAGADGDLTGACYRNANVAELARLPRGLVAADIDLGPYIVALTPHRVLAAPYHRLDQGILANAAIRRGTADEALARMTQLRIDYFATCATQKAATPGSLRAQLLSGARVPGFEEVLAGVSPAIRVWRITPASTP